MAFPIHSTHVGQIYQVHYRWHAYFGADVKVHQVLNRSDGQLVRFEHDAGIVIDAPSWVLDATYCRSFDLGDGRTSLEALFELSFILKELGYRRSFKADGIPSEARHDRLLDPKTTSAALTQADDSATEPLGAPRGDHSSGATASGRGSTSRRASR